MPGVIRQGQSRDILPIELMPQCSPHRRSFNWDLSRRESSRDATAVPQQAPFFLNSTRRMEQAREQPVDLGRVKRQHSRPGRQVNILQGKQGSQNTKARRRESLGFRVQDQARNPIRRPPVLRPECFSFAALVRRISRTSSFSVTIHLAGSGSRLPAWIALRQTLRMSPPSKSPIWNLDRLRGIAVTHRRCPRRFLCARFHRLRDGKTESPCHLVCCCFSPAGNV